MKRRKSQGGQKKIRVLLDTSFILPFFGIMVDDVFPETLESIESADNVEFLYPKLLITELVAKIARECVKKSSCPDTLKNDLIDFLATPELTLVEPKAEHLALAIDLRYAGHPDIFDCIAYATARIEKALFLTLDKKLIEFVGNINQETNLFITQQELIKIIKQKIF